MCGFLAGMPLPVDVVAALLLTTPKAILHLAARQQLPPHYMRLHAPHPRLSRVFWLEEVQALRRQRFANRVKPFRQGPSVSPP